MTNRDLYLFVADLVKRKQRGTRSLEDYLRCVLETAADHAEAPGLAPALFASLLERAFDEPLATPGPSPAGAPGFATLAHLLRRQIADLEALGAAGSLRDEQRYFGLDAPSGHRWYNFDPCTFIECAAAGAFGGWREGDATSRMIVPGPVAVIGEDGAIQAVDPRTLEDPVEELGSLGWEQIADFFVMGQIYE
jgi:hypothetical protein